MKPNSGSAAPAAQGAAAQNNDKKPKMEVVVNNQVKEEKQVLTIDDLKNRASLMVVLSEKHSLLLEKKRSLERFAISHDKNNASILVVDATGEEFKSSSPKTVGKLIEFWKQEFAEAISEVETSLRDTAKIA